MASRFEPGTVHSQKHDPAWMHCHILKTRERTQLKCMYCGKIFSGGGIHRIKEHLACQKGNATTCPRVLPEVRNAMLESLAGAVVKKKKKQKLADEVGIINPANNEVDAFASHCEMDTGLQLLAQPDLLESNLEVLVKAEEVVSKNLDKRKRRRGKNTLMPPLPPATSDVGPPISKFNTGPMKSKVQAHLAIGQFLYDAGIPLTAMYSIYFQPMIDAIASAGPGLEAPSYHDVRGEILRVSLEEVKALLEQYKGTIGRTGCSVTADEWMTETGKTLINFLVYCPEGTMFLRSVDASDIVTSVDALYELLKAVVEEVGVKNVLQVITNNSENYALAGKRLSETFPTMFWTPCAAHSVNLMLKDIGKLDSASSVLEHAKSITRFIYSHSRVLNMMRKYTGGVELIQPTTTRSTTNFTTLRSIVNLKGSLTEMVTSQEWAHCPDMKKPAGIAAAELICSPAFWSSCTTIVHLTEPLVQVLRMAGSYTIPAMGYIYEGMYRAKAVIKNELKRRKDYAPYWNIIDWRWDRRFHRPLHAAGFFLNPRFFYSVKGDVHNEVMSGMLDCIERLVPEIKVQDKINKELSSYKNGSGDFGRKMALRAKNTLLPAEWWSTYGGVCPNLTRLAVRVLSQTCSASGCERNGIPFEQLHNLRGNRLEYQRLSDLIFVQYNLRLQHRRVTNSRQVDPISFDNIDIVGDWVVEKREPFFGDDEDSNWMAIDQPITNIIQSGSMNEEADSLDLGYEDEEIYNMVKDDENDEDRS